MAQVKRKHASRKRITQIIEREVSFFNGWSVSEEYVRKACDKATTKILRYLGLKETIKL
jgi:hypothetical protein